MVAMLQSNAFYQNVSVLLIERFDIFSWNLFILSNFFFSRSISYIHRYRRS